MEDLAAAATGGNFTCPSFAAPDWAVAWFESDYLGVDQKSLQYTLEGQFNAYWKDPRLRFDDRCGLGTLVLGDASLLWKPDFYFKNAADIEFATDGNGLAELVRVLPDGGVYWSRQARVTLRCKMHFGDIPFDTQRCEYSVGLYSQNEEETVHARPSGGGFIVNWETASTNVWKVTINDEDNRITTDTSVDSFPRSVSSTIVRLERRPQGYVYAYVVMAILGVAMSYAGFFINPAATPGRVALAVITVLCVSSGLSAARSQVQPPSSTSVHRAENC
eukprot:6218282-Prymnesium_polylepis.1